MVAITLKNLNKLLIKDIIFSVPINLNRTCHFLQLSNIKHVVTNNFYSCCSYFKTCVLDDRIDQLDFYMHSA